MKIDKRIVEMGFENKGFEAGVKQSQSSLQDLDRSLAQAGKGTSFSPLGSVVEGIGGKFSLLGTIATGALLKIGSQAVVAGQQLINSLGMEQVNAGFQEYELKIGSIRTMLAGGRDKNGLPVTLEMVNEQLEALNKYSDQTIYSFSDMTRNIGKFTNAGVDLETAVQAIKGISNAAALAGANSDEASRAMYNFSQALSAGYVKLIDWKSIETANMATVDFKAELLKTAAALGTVKENADGTYQVLTDGGWGLPLAPTKNFNDSLQKQWMTSEVLTQTLTKYTDTTTELGKKATDAAQMVRTFTQLMDTTKESLGSGWAMTAENIFGDYEEATKLWSGVSNVLGDIILKSSDARNSMLKDWKELGGRRYVIEGIATAWENFISIADSVKLAFRDVFPPITATNLRNLSVEFKLFMKALTPTADTLSKTKIIFEGLFSALSLGWQLVESVFKGLFDGIKRVVDLIPPGENGGILGFLSKIAIFFIQLKDSAEKADTFAKIATKISDVIILIAGAIGKFYQIIAESKITKILISNLTIAINWFKESFLGLINAIKESSSISDIFKEIGTAFEQLINSDKLANTSNGISKFFNNIALVLKPIGKFLVDTFSSIKNAVSEKWKIEGFGGLLDLINTVLHGGVLVMLADLIKTLSGLFGSAGSLGSGFTGILGSLKTTLQSYQDSLKAKTLLLIAGAIGILALSVIGLSMVNSQRLTDAVFALGMLFAQLTGSMIVLDKAMGSKGISTLGLQLLALSVSILLISSALAVIAKIPADRLTESIKALAAVLFELVVFSKLMGGSQSFIGASVGLLAMSVAINIIVLAVKSLGNMDPQKLKQGLIALAEIGGGLAVFSVVVSQLSRGGNLLAAGVAMTIIAGVILQLIGAVALLGIIRPDILARGLVALGVILAEIVAFSIFISQAINPINLLAAAASMAVMAIAILEIVGAVALLGGMKAESLTQGLMGLGGTLIILAGGMAILSNPSFLIGASVMIIMAGAIMLLTPSLLALGAVPIENIGKALLALAGVFIVVGLAGYLLMPIVPSILAVAAAIAIFGAGILAIGLGMSLFGAGLAALSAGGVAAIGLMVIAIKEIVLLIPSILTALARGIIEFAKVIKLGAPIIAEAIGAILSSLLALLSNEVPKLIEVLLDFISFLLKELVEKVPEFIDAGMKIIIGFLEGISANIQRVIELVIEMVINILNGIAEKLPDLIESGANIIIAFLEGIGREVPRVVDAAFQMIIDFINGLADSIRDNTKDILEAAENLATAFTDGIKDYLNVEEGETIAGNIIKGLINGIVNGAENVVQSAKDLAADILNGINNVFGNHSPSKVTTQMGEYLDLGLIEGLKNRSQNVINAAKDLGESSIDALRSTMKKISDAVDGEINSSPVITPVLDLNKVRSGATNLSSLLSTGQSYNLAALKLGDDKLIEKNNQNGSNSSKETTQIIKNEFNLNGVTIRSEGDIDKLAEQLYNKQENAMRSRGIKPAYVY